MGVLLYEARQIDVVTEDQDLHYTVRDANTDAVLAGASPVRVEEIEEQRAREGGFRRLLRTISVPRRLPGESVEVPRVTLRVADPGGATLFFVDRARKMSGNRFPPHCAVVDPAGGVLGFVTNDHRQMLEAPDLMKGPFDSDGASLITGRGHLNAWNHEIVCDVVVRAAATEPARQALAAPGADKVRFAGRDGVQWGRLIGDAPTLDCNPQIAWQPRALLIASMIAGRMDERLHAPMLVDGSGTAPPPLRTAGEPYPGYRGVHEHYMAYQAEFIEWYEQEMRRRGRGAAAYAGD